MSGVIFRYSNPVNINLPSSFPTLERRQVRHALLELGIVASQVEAALLSIEDPKERESALIEWQDAQRFRRDHPLILRVAEVLLPEMTKEQIDEVWMAAVNL